MNNKLLKNITMKFVTERPINYDSINNLDLRSDFENEDDEPLLFTHFKACGSINDIFEAFAIDQYDEDGDNVLQSFLYNSRLEYEQDCKILGI